MADIAEKLDAMRAGAQGAPAMIPTKNPKMMGEVAPETEEPLPEQTAGMGLKDSEAMIAEKAQDGSISAGAVQHDGNEIVNLSKQDHPEVADDAEGNRVVFVVGGTVKSVDESNVVVSVDEVSVIHGGKPPLGTGERFKNLTEKLRNRGSRDPEALAAWIGRKNLGAKRFNELAAKGRRNG